MGEKLWKQTERRIARFFGGEVTERIGRRGVDVQTDWLSIEIKTRKKLPAWIKDAVAYARAHADGDKLGIAVLHALHSHNDLVVLSIHDFRDWFGELHRKAGV